MKYISAFLIVLLPVFTFSQPIRLKGKVIDINQQPVKNLSLRFTTFGDAVTTGSGEFVISLPSDVLYADVTIRNAKWQLLYPVDGKIAVPADQNFINTVIVSGTDASGGTGIDQAILRYAELESLLKETGTAYTELQAFLEKFIEIESERFEISETRFREEFEMRLSRETAFAEISRILKNYILKAGNLKTSFELNTELAFVSIQAGENLNNSIRAYNPVFDSIYNNYNNWKSVISLARDTVIAENLASAVIFMINEIHDPYIFQLNDCIKLVNEVRFNIGNIEEKKKIARDKVSVIIQNLNEKVPVLENRFNELADNLLHAGVN